MNKFEKFAVTKYTKNKSIDLSGLSAYGLGRLCREQDTLYKVIHRRVDARIFGYKNG